MAASKSPAPKGLDSRGRRFWRDVHATWEFNRDERELLVEVCRTLDTCEQLQGTLASDGLTIAGSTGQTRVHPAVGELRSSRQLLARLIAQLGLPDPYEQTMDSPATTRARRAAQSRWNRRIDHGA